MALFGVLCMVGVALLVMPSFWAGLRIPRYSRMTYEDPKTGKVRQVYVDPDTAGSTAKRAIKALGAEKVEVETLHWNGDRWVQDYAAGNTNIDERPDFYDL